MNLGIKIWENDKQGCYASFLVTYNVHIYLIYGSHC